MVSKNDILEKERIDKLKWYINSHGHSSVGALNLLWTYFNFNNKNDVEILIENIINMYKTLPEGNIKINLQNLKNQISILDKQIKFISKKEKENINFTSLISTIKKNLNLTESVIGNIKHKEKYDLDEIMHFSILDFHFENPNMLYGNYLKIDKGYVKFSFEKDKSKKKIKICSFDFSLLFFTLLENSVNSIVGNGLMSPGVGEISIKSYNDKNNKVYEITDNGELLNENDLIKLNSNLPISGKLRNKNNNLILLNKILKMYKIKSLYKTNHRENFTKVFITIPYYI